ncbi:unnamed protein product [Peniophora sp. CBMAI 1063]|nr:unnamed protein product [Peniophora sp. CBMAI 1063]
MASDSQVTLQVSDAGAVTGQKDRVKAYAAALVWQPGEFVDLGLSDDARTLIHQGKLFSHSSIGLGRTHKWTELFVLLFDNYLVITEPREQDGITNYHVTRRPIPLELLATTNVAHPPIQRGAVQPSPNLLATLGGLLRSGDSDDSLLVYPCEIAHVGRSGSCALYAESEEARVEWKEKLSKAQSLRIATQEGNKVFDVKPLSGDPGTGTPITGRVTCSLAFSSKEDERVHIVFGGDEGVWTGVQDDLSSIRHVLDLKRVTQCAVLEDFGILVVLADGTLSAYPLDLIVSIGAPQTDATLAPLKLSEEIVCFSVGQILGRTLLVYMWKRNRDSTFRVLEAISLKETVQSSLGTEGHTQYGLDDRCFRVHRESFFLQGADCYDMMFLKSRAAISYQKGFAIMDLTDDVSVTIPVRDNLDKELAKRCDSCRPMKILRTSENEFLLCYEEFGLFVTRHGDPVHDKPLMEWEGKAEQIAWNAPYVVAFNEHFVEVHNVETAQLIQIIRGEGMCATWDGRGTARTPAEAPAGGQVWVFDSQTRIHGVMRHAPPESSPDPLAGTAVPGAQYVFELVPKVSKEA